MPRPYRPARLARTTNLARLHGHKPAPLAALAAAVPALLPLAAVGGAALLLWPYVVGIAQALAAALALPTP